jgi:phage terminase large subunit-like protein
MARRVGRWCRGSGCRAIRLRQSRTRDRVQYQRWIEAGYIEVTQGNVVDQNEIQAAIIEDCRLHEALSVAYDPWNATQLR